MADTKSPTTNSLITRGLKPRFVKVQNPYTLEWRTVVRFSQQSIDDNDKAMFLQEFAEHGRIVEAAAAAGTTQKVIKREIKNDPEFAEAFELAEAAYRDRLIAHHQNLVFNGSMKRVYDKEGNVIAEEQIFPIRLIELELKKHDAGYRDKQEIDVKVSGGVLVAPAETKSIDDWEKRFSGAKDVTPTE